MTHLIYVYLVINSFIAGNYLFDVFNDDSSLRKFGVFSVLFLFGTPWILLYLVSELPIFMWIKNEIIFIYHFYITDYWDKILLDDNYSEEHKTREEKLKRANQITKNASKQVKRHNRLVQKKYGR